MTGDRGRAARGLAVLAVGLVAACGLRLMASAPIDGGIAFGWPSETVVRLRLTAIAAGVSVGAALAVAGVMLQALLRNPLASPFVLGVSAGASLGVAVVLAVALTGAGAGAGLVASVVRAAGAGGHAVPAAVGAGLALATVAALGRGRAGTWMDPLAVLLAGVVVSAVCGSLVLALEHVAPGGLRQGMLAWMTGTIDDLLPGATLRTVAIAAGLGTLAGTVLAPSLDVLALGEDEARSVGASVGGVRTGLFIASGLLTAAAVAAAGPIAFVGLIAPHAARGLVGAGHRLLVPAAALAGAALLVAADAASQLLRIEGGRLPVGVFTALVGGPLFLMLLRRVRESSAGAGGGA